MPEGKLEARCTQTCVVSLEPLTREVRKSLRCDFFRGRRHRKPRRGERQRGERQRGESQIREAMRLEKLKLEPKLEQLAQSLHGLLRWVLAMT